MAKKASEGAAPAKQGARRQGASGPLRDDRLDSDVNEVLELVSDIQRAVDRQLKALSRRNKLSQRGMFTLGLIHAGLDRSSLLVEYFDTLPSTMTVETDRLVEAGLIVRKNETHDRRIIRLELTRKGHKLRMEIMDTVNSMFLPRFNQVPGEDLKQCVATLRKIAYSTTD